jgi:hypothetical protein
MRSEKTGWNSDALLPVALVAGGVKNGGNDHNLLGFNHLIDHAVGKPVRITPANVLVG